MGNIFIFATNIFSMKPKEITEKDHEFLLKIGKRIKELRKDKQLAYIELAKQVEISKNTYNQMELGNINFQIGSLLAILKYHDIGFEQFFKEL